RGGAARAVAFGLAALVLPLIAYAVLSDLVWHRPVYGAAAALAPGGGGVALPVAGTGSPREAFSYAWQLFLPKLGIFTTLHPTPHPFEEIWFDGFVGQFGWLDYGFPAWVYTVAKPVGAVVVALALATLIRERRAVLRRRWELLTLLVAVAGLAAVIGLAGYDYWRASSGGRFEQARYLLPLLGLYGAGVALAVRAGRGAAPIVAACVVTIAVGWSVYAQILTVLRYYG
ncbi:MAG: DUF2142 domain-containing protein, partial [Solirubrobacteraceae bacterium]